MNTKIEKITKAGLLIMCFFLILNKGYSQSGACGTGVTINESMNINFNIASAGEHIINAAGSLRIAVNGDYRIYGSLTNNGSITVLSGGVLNVYGNVTNNGTITINPGGVVTFYGQEWVNGSSAVVTGSGSLTFSERVILGTISASWLAAAPCLSNYSGGSFPQNLNGGGTGVDMAVNLGINNANDVILTGTTSIAGVVSFNVLLADIVLGGHDLVLTSTGSFSGHSNRNFVATNGTGHVVKEGLPVGASFLFPLSRARFAGVNLTTYTPVSITNNGTAADNFYVSVKNYAESASNESVSGSANGVNRTWNIYSTNGSAANIALHHHGSTNGANYTSDADAFVTQYIADTTWQTGTGATGTNAAGTYAGSVIHNRSYASTATSANANSSFFSKSTNLLNPLPITILEFNARKFSASSSLLTWATITEVNSLYFDVERLIGNSVWVKIGKVMAAGNSNGLLDYSLIDFNPEIGKNYYRLKMVSINNEYRYSDVRTVDFTPSDNSNTIQVFPNPAIETLNIGSTIMLGKITITDANGKVVLETDVNNNKAEIDIMHLANGNYTVNVQGQSFVWIKQ